RGSLDGGGRKIDIETNQTRAPGDLWSAADWFLRNSPIFNADKISAPLLLMNNPLDRAIPYSQGVEFFTALRRLGKKAWMLEYDNAGHSLFGMQADDYTIRMEQFFNHYLKGSPAPKWMIDGLPLKLKNIENGLDLKSVGIEPGPGLNNEDLI